MNIEIANRLVNLRKSNNLSQEALAAKLGISRQAVSKWERAEASPDTDNLILLARLYNVSLDELLRTEDEIPIPEERDAAKEEFLIPEMRNTAGENFFSPDMGSADRGNDREGDETEREGHFGHYIPISTIITILYFIIGVVYNAWHPGWLLFLLIPIWASLVCAINRKNANCFAYPVLATLIYLCGGCFWNAWHPGWIIFLTIPLYHSAVSCVRSFKRRHGRYGQASSYYDGKDGREDEE